MATLTLASAFDFSENGDWFWNPTLVTSSSVSYDDGKGHTLLVSGSFTLQGNLVSSGTVTGVSFFKHPLGADGTLPANLQLVYDIKGISFDAVTLALQVDNSPPQQVYGMLLAGNDTITGSAEADILLGYVGSDTIAGGAGNDTITGGAGNDAIDGGAGIDTARYSGNSTTYTIARTSTGFTVTDKSGVEGVDTLAGVERLQFGDKAVALDVDAGSVGGQVYRLYNAAFARTPDAGGVGFWMSAMEKGTSLSAIAQGFINSTEYKDAYGTSLSNHDLVTKFYQNILHRQPEQGGLDFWTGVLDEKKAPLADVLAAISESSENITATATIIGNGFEYTPHG